MIPAHPRFLPLVTLYFEGCPLRTVVLGEMEKAKTAYGRAREHFGGKPDALAALDATAKELKIE